MKFTAAMLKSDDPGPFEIRYGDDMTQAYLTVADWKMMCQEVYNFHQLLEVLIKDLDTLETEIADLKKKVSEMEARK